jgi:hypothetical protein
MGKKFDGAFTHAVLPCPPGKQMDLTIFFNSLHGNSLIAASAPATSF